MTVIVCSCDKQVDLAALPVHLELNHRRLGDASRAQLVRNAERYGRITKRVGR